MQDGVDPEVPCLPPNVERAKGGYLIGGRFVRDYKGSKRPPWIWPEVWKIMHVAAREKETAEWEVLRGRLEAAEAAAQNAPPNASSSSSSSAAKPAALCAGAVDGDVSMPTCLAKAFTEPSYRITTCPFRPS